MKKMIALTLGLMAMMGLMFASAALADTTGNATADIVVRVNPNVTVGVLTAIVDAGTVQTGTFTATIRYRIDANVEAVALYVEASPLYKGNDPTNTDVAPIPLNLTAGATIAAANANPINAGTNVANFINPTALVRNFPAAGTETIVFESSQNGHFSQDVTVAVSWLQDDPEKPQGEYSGVVRLTALILPLAG